MAAKILWWLPETIVICPTEHQRALWPATGRGHTPLVLCNLSSRLGSKALCGQLRYVCLYARKDYEHGIVCFIGGKVLVLILKGVCVFTATLFRSILPSRLTEACHTPLPQSCF